MWRRAQGTRLREIGVGFSGRLPLALRLEPFVYASFLRICAP